MTFIWTVWELLRKDTEYLPGDTIGKIKLENNKIVIWIKILPADNPKDAAIHPLQGTEITFWIKQWLLEHLCDSECCLRYVIIHEFTHLVNNFQFPLPWELRGFGKETMYTVHHYMIDALIDRWNVINKNYTYDDPINFVHLTYQENKINFTITTRKELFENYIYFAKFASHCETWKNNLYQHAHRFPHQLRDKYHKLLDILSGVHPDSDSPIYELIRDIAELILCSSKKDVMERELKRRYHTLSDIGEILFNDSNDNPGFSIQNLWNKRIINIFQLKNCFFDWNRTFKRIINISSNELRYIDEFLSEPPNTNEFFFSYFL